MADTPGTQDAPIEEGATEATRTEQIRGILDQVPAAAAASLEEWPARD